jgi:ATP-binding cassette subfamily C protein CydD
MAMLRIAFMSALVLELLATLGVALVAVSVGLRLVFGDLALSTALTALLLAPEVFWPLRRVGTEFHAAQDGQAAAAKATDLLDVVAAPSHGQMIASATSIRLEAVGVAGRGESAPRDLTVDVTPGSITVLTGPNGSGKSTALEVMLGLTPPTSGRALIGGIDAAELDPRSWWREVAWLPQRPVMVPGTVRANLELFGQLPDIETACRATGFDEVLATLPDGLDTVIGREGPACRSVSGNDSPWPGCLVRLNPYCCSTNRPHTSTSPWNPVCCGPSWSGRGLAQRSSSSGTANPSSR